VRFLWAKNMDAAKDIHKEMLPIWAFMEPESPSPYPQVPSTCPYPEPYPSSPQDPHQLPNYFGNKKELPDYSHWV
jgi:hypothetical protein